MAIDVSVYEAGSGLTVDSTQAVFLSMVFPLAALWSVWVIYRAYRGWANSRLTTWDLVSVGLQVFVILGVMLTTLT